MTIDPITEDFNCPYCLSGKIGKTITQNLKNPDNYLKGVIIITTFIWLRCQNILHREIREITI